MAQQILESLGRFLPETALAVTFCVSLVATLVARKRPLIVGGIAIAGVAVALVFALQQAGMAGSAFGGMLAVDPFAVFFKSLVATCALIILVFSFFSSEVLSTVRRMGEYFSLLVALTLGMFLMTGANTLLMMVLGMELASLSSYLLTGYTKEAADSSEASLKYIIFGALSSGFMLYGISILYGLTGALELQAVNRGLAGGVANPYALLIATVLILVGLGYKISAVPFHFWTPDVYEGAPITITAFLSVASKAAGFSMLIRFFKVVFIDSSVVGLPAGMWATLYGFEWNKIIAILSVLTMTLGNLVAVWQNNLKRLLAYSSIAHAGYMLMGVVVLSDKGLAAVLIYFMMYLFMNLGAFYVVMIVANKTGSEDIDSYKGLGSRAPLLGVAMAIFMVSLTGLPPTAGFIGKLYLFAALLDARWIWLAIVGALNSVVSLYYYARVFRNIFLRDAEGTSSPVRISLPQTVVLLLLLVPTLLFGVYFTPIVNMANASLMMIGIR
jgi:NADH-quinone oxidoreductase subunit N